ncbi:MAG: hypothetical protein IKE16_04915, partial [Solobacterium sp.]|nr:hypothetical protein [Solobacterium sp.]
MTKYRFLSETAGGKRRETAEQKKEGLSLLCTTADSCMVHDSDHSIAFIAEQFIVINGCYIFTDHGSIGLVVYHKNGITIDA